MSHTCTISDTFKQCVRDRAIESVKIVTDCRSSEARNIVNEVFNAAFDEEL